MTHEILIPYVDSPYTYALIFCLEALYETKSKKETLFNKGYFVINTKHNLGKNPALRILKRFEYEYILFIKEGIIFKKYLDTGIVDKLGEKDNVKSI